MLIWLFRSSLPYAFGSISPTPAASKLADAPSSATSGSAIEIRDPNPTQMLPAGVLFYGCKAFFLPPIRGSAHALQFHKPLSMSASPSLPTISLMPSSPLIRGPRA
ncbi:hypothetical protein PIB30_038614 [Stylosanthes scabra]|uniref:Secreted protein n=1 Tax=Stylosanthes scabra TaxID=79078 RepID=A0ABU6SED5_9FABA|nr:hypothetical protein [Stylosanthes scabra]